MLGTKIAQGEKDDPVDVAQSVSTPLMRGDGDTVSGWTNKLQTAIASVTPLTAAAAATSTIGSRPNARSSSGGVGTSEDVTSQNTGHPYRSASSRR